MNDRAGANAAQQFDWSLPYASRRQPVFARHVVATSQPLATQAGVAMLARGGNAVDAALATAITLTVVEPCSNGIGSDLFAIVWDGESAGRPQRVGTRAGRVDRRALCRGRARCRERGWDTVTIPGAVSGWARAVEALRQAAASPICSSPRFATRATATSVSPVDRARSGASPCR